MFHTGWTCDEMFDADRAGLFENAEVVFEDLLEHLIDWKQDRADLFIWLIDKTATALNRNFAPPLAIASESKALSSVQPMFYDLESVFVPVDSGRVYDSTNYPNESAASFLGCMRQRFQLYRHENVFDKYVGMMSCQNFAAK